MITSVYPFKSQFIRLTGYNIHYVECGQGMPVLFLHGNPTYSYLWRNIIPTVSKYGRCLAPDLLGFGRSDKPNVEYTFSHYAAIVEGFIKKLDLTGLVMILHDWGGAFGFWYAIHNRKNVRGIAFMETFPFVLRWDEYSDERKVLFEKFRTPGVNYQLVQVQNMFLERMLPLHLGEKATAEVMEKYREPFPTVESRKAIRRFPEMLPIGESSETYHEIKKIEDTLPTLKFPMLLIKGTPGSIIHQARVDYLKAKIRDLEVVDVGPAKHFIMEEHPEEVTRAIVNWLQRKVISITHA